MPFKIGRVPRGLSEVLTIFGGVNPVELEDRAAGVIELLQFYGMQQLQRLSASDAALAETGNISIQLQSWGVLFGANARAVQTSTMTALRLNILLNRTANASAATSIPIASGGPLAYGATFTGDFDLPLRLPYPLICPPGTLIQANLPLLGTDATANVNILAEVGILG